MKDKEPILPDLRIAEVIAQPFGTFINADCLSVMKGFSDKQFNLAIVDVPYGIGEDGSKNHTRSVIAKSKNYKAYAGNDTTAPTQEYWNEFQRISKNQIVWGANHFISLWPFDSSCWIVWDKENGENDFADCELAWTSFDTAVRKFKWKWQGMLQQNMKNKQERIHPNEKPVQLYEWLLRNYAKPGDSIVDTHLGSASIGIAVDKVNKLDHMNLTLTGIELDSYYFKKSMSRLKEHSS
ncbi:MAG: DNA methyltransferase, partial [Acetobacterium sp.]|nr:DNA methyltransferase [Acetobacterium sp.]